MSSRYAPTQPPPQPPTPSGSSRRGAFGFWLVVVRGLSVVDALFLLAQPVWIGQYLTGVYGWLGIHSAGGIFAAMSGVGLLVASLGYALSGGRWRLPLIALILVVAEIFQTHEGFVRNLAVHIPLGVFVIVSGVAVTIAVFTRSFSRPRPRVAEVPPPVGASR